MHWTSATHALVMTCLRVWDITHSVPFVFVAGIAFLRGFQVSLQALGGSSVACQLFLFNRNLSLTVSHAQMVGRASRYLSLFSCLLCCFWQNKLFTRVLMLFYSQECFWVWVWINNKIILFIWIKFFLIFFFSFNQLPLLFYQMHSLMACWWWNDATFWMISQWHPLPK